MNFLMSSNIFHEFGFEMAKPEDFRPVVIPTPAVWTKRPWCSLNRTSTYKTFRVLNSKKAERNAVAGKEDELQKDRHTSSRAL